MDQTQDILTRRKVFRDWFADELRRREWTQADFSRRSGLSTSVLSRWMNLQSTPDTQSCDIIADIFGIDIDRVLTIAGHRPDLYPEEGDELADLQAMMRRIQIKPSREFILRNILKAWIDEDREGYVFDIEAESRARMPVRR